MAQIKKTSFTLVFFIIQIFLNIKMNNFITCSLYLYSRIFFYFYLKERVKHEKTVSLLILGLFAAVFSYSPVSAENIQDQSSLNLRKEKAGAKDGLKYGLKDGLKNGLKDGAKNGRINGDKK